ncbi:nSTAND1 domain-containing NTPase [Streptomyces sp. NPDC054834]
MAGRPESPLDPSAGPVARFAAELRKLRAEAGSPTYRVMAQRAGQGASTLSQAAAGERLPTLPVVLAYVRACSGDLQEWEARWRETAAEEAGEPRTSDEEEEPPYRGLARFEPGDADLFFGRDELTDRLLELTRTRRFTAVFGPSGSGKSSLLRAGLIPRLRSPRPTDPQPAAVRVLTPGEHPLRVHEQRLIPKEADGDTWLIVDQFEELYTLCTDPAERNQFIDRLLATTDPASRLRVVIAVRADFLGRCAEHPALTAALQDSTVLAGPMSRDELRQAVTRPAQAAGMIVERALTARILDEVEGEPGALPLMSHALLETWRRRKGRALTGAAYEAAGGLHGAIARTADDLYARLTPTQAELARRLVLRLITPGDGTPDTRRPTSRTELDFADPANTSTVLERLAGARLITVDDTTVDLAHEALITAWPRLQTWIDAERDRLRLHRQLTDAADAWHSLGRDPGALYRGVRLAAAEEAFEVTGYRAALTTREAEFLTASLEMRRREQRTAARATRRLRSLIAVLSVLSLVTSVTAVIALQQRASARAERNTAISNRIITEADQLRGTGMTGTSPQAQDVSLATRLDIVAYRMQHSPQAYTNLVTATTAVLSTTFTSEPDSVSNVVFSPRAHVLAAVEADGSHPAQVQLWNTDASAHPERFGHLPDDRHTEVTAVAFSPDGRTLATATAPSRGSDTDTGTPARLQLWDVTRPAHPRLAGTSASIPDRIDTVDFSPDGRTLATTGDNSRIRLWDATDPVSPRLLAPLLRGSRNETGILAFAPWGHLLATAEEDLDDAVRLWDVADPAHPRRVGSLPSHHVTALAFAQHGHLVATTSGGSQPAVQMWDATNSAHPRRLGEPITTDSAVLDAARLSPDGRTLAAAEDGSVRLWNVSDPSNPLPWDKPLAVSAPSVAFSPDGRSLATGGDGVHLWSLPGTVLRGYPGPVHQTAFDSTGHLLATAGDALGDQDNPDMESAIWLWDTTNPANPRRVSVSPSHSVHAMALSPDGHLLATSTAEVDGSAVRLWDTTDPARPRVVGHLLDRRGSEAIAVTFGADGHTLATASTDQNGGRVWLWDTKDPAHPRRLSTVPAPGIRAMALSPDTDLLAVATSDNDGRSQVQLWHITDPAHPTRLDRLSTGHSASGDSTPVLEFSPDGQLLATAGNGTNLANVQLWDTSDPAHAERLGHLQAGGKDDLGLVLAFSPDQRILATAGAGEDGARVQLWDTADPAHPTRLGHPLTGHTDTVNAMAFSSHGHTLATAGNDGTVRLWATDADQAITQICAETGNTLTTQQWNQYVGALPYRSPCP